MSCFACSKKYGFFTKEVGCPNCGFSFCTKCLKKEIEVPKHKNHVKKVCLACYEKLFKQTQENSTNLSGKSNQPISILDEETPPLVQPPLGTPEAEEATENLDDAIRNRLAAIKEPLQPTKINENRSDTDIGQRLAILKDQPHREYDHKKLLNAVDNRNEHEKTNDLLKQFLEENEIDQVADGSSGNQAGEEEEDPIRSIEKRLAALKGTSADLKNVPTGGDENIDDDTAAKNLAKRYLEESKLPDFELTPEEKEFVNSIPKTETTEELPWCNICNEDAKIRCIDCDGDLFCVSCFKEIHANDEEYREHRTKIYEAPAKKAHEY